MSATVATPSSEIDLDGTTGGRLRATRASANGSSSRPMAARADVGDLSAWPAPRGSPNRGGYKTTPSMVAITEGGYGSKRLVGHIAKRQAITNAENTVYAAKRLIGRKWNSPQVQAALKNVAYRIVEGPHGDAHPAARQGLLGARDLRDDPAGDEDDRGGLPRRRSRRRSSRSPRTSTTASARPPRTRARSPGSTSSASSTSRRPRPSPTASARTSTRPSRSTTSAAARSTSPSWRSAPTACSRSSPRRATRSSAARTSTARHRLARRGLQGRARHRPAPGPHGPPAPQGRRGEGQVRAVERRRDRGQPAVHHLERANEALHLQRLLTRSQLEELCEDLVKRTIEICEMTLEEAGLERTRSRTSCSSAA
jgi:hypothetical protein